MGIRKSKKEIVKLLMNKNLEEQQEEELMDLIIDSPVSVDIDKQEEELETKKDHIADKVASIAGSWTFIICFAMFLLLWIILNVLIFTTNTFEVDPYPFILLNLFLSCLAALQAPVIMMSQNRQAKKDSLRSKNDYHVDLKSELILEYLCEQQEKLLKNQKELYSYLKNPDSELKMYTQSEVDEIVKDKVQKEIEKLKHENEKN